MTEGKLPRLSDDPGWAVLRQFIERHTSQNAMRLYLFDTLDDLHDEAKRLDGSAISPTESTPNG